MNSGGSQKTISSAFANISGSQKQIFPPIYTWERYNTKKYLISGGVDNGSTSSWHYPVSWAEECEVYEVYNFTIVTGSPYGIRMDSYSFYGYLSGGVPSGYWIDSTPDALASWIWYGDYVSREPDSLGNDGYMLYSTAYGINGNYKKVKDTYQDMVTSTNRNAYPDDGISGSYYYVFKG